jgi:acylphosphatase
MKLKITTVGPKVHDVGYRYHLLYLARGCKIKCFDAENQTADGQQAVEVLVEGDDDQITKFRESVDTDMLQGAEDWLTIRRCRWSRD